MIGWQVLHTLLFTKWLAGFSWAFATKAPTQNIARSKPERTAKDISAISNSMSKHIFGKSGSYPPPVSCERRRPPGRSRSGRGVSPYSDVQWQVERSTDARFHRLQPRPNSRGRYRPELSVAFR